MEIMLNKCLLAIVTIKPEKIGGNGVPVFLCSEREEMEQTASKLGKLMGAMVHEISEELYVVVRH